MSSKAITYLVLILLLLPYLAIGFTVFSPTVSDEREEYRGEVVTDLPKPLQGKMIRVALDGSGDYRSLNEAMKSASPGDSIIIFPGAYVESVTVKNKPWISIEGTDRDRVILDGQMKLGNGIFIVNSPHVKIANLTVRDYAGNGVFYVNSDHFELRNVVSLNNQVYGLYALASRKGIFSGVVASGSGDSGLYIGDVFDCECVIENSIAYNNVLGYSGTRAIGVTIRNSRFYNNSVGIGPNTLMPDLPRLATGRWRFPFWTSNHVIENNIVEGNNNRSIKAVGFAATFGVPVGTGIALIGSFGNVIRNNIIKDNGKWGVAEWFFLLPPIGNIYIKNRFESNGIDYWRDGWGFGSCSEAEQASGDVPLACSLPPWARIPARNPLKHFELLTNVESPGVSGGLASVGGFLFAAVLAHRTAKPASNKPLKKNRLASGLVDGLFVGNLYIILASILIVVTFGITDFRGLIDALLSLTFLLLPLAYFIWVTLWVVYGFLLEAITGRTIGKGLVGLRVVRNSRKPAMSRLLVKNLLRYVDLLAFGLPAVISIMVWGGTVGELVAGVHVEKK